MSMYIFVFLDNGKIIWLYPPHEGGIRPTLLQAVATTPHSHNVIKVRSMFIES